MIGHPLTVSALTVAYRQGSGWMRVVDGVSFAVTQGEVFGLVGESGCGKSTVALQLLGFRHPSMRVEAGHVLFRGQDIAQLERAKLDQLRGNRISYVPQNPTTALNPGIRIARQVAEVLQAHSPGVNAAALDKRTAEVLAMVGLPSDVGFRRRYPHELSGGQQQRVCIAMALACNPEVVVLDEPTTGLDVTTQEQILALLIDLRSRFHMSMLYVTHDLGLLSQIADRVAVMYAGRIVEVAPSAELFTAPRHPYTRGLIDSIPRIEDSSGRPPHPMRGLLERNSLPPGCPFSPRCDFSRPGCSERPQELEPAGTNRWVACWRWRDVVGHDAPPPAIRVERALRARPLLTLEGVCIRYGRRDLVVRDVSFSIAEGETFALVGESGSGKSTLARAISGLVPPDAGTIALKSAPLPARLNNRTREQRRAIQFIFQNPDASLNPRVRIGDILARPIEFFFGRSPAEVRSAVKAALQDVRLDGSYAARFADQLSGGERQRVAIARALIADPLILLCDEILSALDVSVQANILALLHRLKLERGITMLLISHDLAVVRMLADRVCVLFRGQVMEMGKREEVFSPPFHPYTHSLLQSVPTQRRWRKSPLRTASSGGRGGGCAYAGRCPWQAGTICEREAPPWREGPGDLRIRCHLTTEELCKSAEWPSTSTSRHNGVLPTQA
jgi:peptide/nickel transport system ATP-binding protein